MSYKKGIKDFLFGDKCLITFDEKRIKERIGIIERVLKLVDSVKNKKKYRKLSIKRTFQTTMDTLGNSLGCLCGEAKIAEELSLNF